MRKSMKRQKLKSTIAFLLILLLLPYVVTVFVHGVEMDAAWAEADYVKVKIRGDDGKDEVISIPWKQYMVGILARELPVECEKELAKAQAVIVRTKLYDEMEEKKNNGEPVVLEESYLTSEEIEKKLETKNYESYYTMLLDAVRETENQVLKYENKYAFVPFHQSSCGIVRSGEEVFGTKNYPYLVTRECPEDKKAQDEMQVVTLDYKEVQKKCCPFLKAVPEEEMGKVYTFSDFEILSYDSAGYVKEIRIGETVCSGDCFREALSLASGAFSIKDSGGKLSITTMGRGHGLGMSQWTAQAMAKEGENYETILQHFYEGTMLENGGEIFTKME